MTDLEITRACAKAMGGDMSDPEGRALPLVLDVVTQTFALYDPLHDDAQAMALVKRFRLNIAQLSKTCKVFPDLRKGYFEGENPDLNRAICECVARLSQGGQKDIRK